MRSHFYNSFLLHFLHCFLILFQNIRYALYVLNTAVVTHNFLPQAFVPDVVSNEVIHQVFVDLNKLT